MTLAIKRLLVPAALLALVAALLAPGAALAQSKKHRQRAREHFQQAEAFMKVKVYDKAIEEYRAGYKLMPSAHGFLFNIGLAYERMGKASRALDHYRMYLKRDPRGKKRVEARARAAALARQVNEDKPEPRSRSSDSEEPIDIQGIENDAAASELRTGSAGGEGAEAARTGATLAGMPASPALLSKPEQKPLDTDTGVGWRHVAVGAGLFTLGLMFDGSRVNPYDGNLADVIAIGLYTGGGYFVVRGVF